MGARTAFPPGRQTGGMNGSGKVSPARLAAFEVLLQVETRAAYSHIALRQALRRQRLDRRNSALATEIVYGVLQWQRWLDERLARYSRIPVDRLDPPVRVALRMAAYQLLKLKGVAAHAAVYEAVELVKAALPRAAGFANGLLRSVLRRPPAEDESALPAGTPEAVARVTSHPTWMVQHWWEWLGPDTTERFCRSNNEPSVLTLRANTLRSSPAEVAEAVRAAGGEAEVSPVVPEAVRVAGGVDVSTLPPFRTGACTVQDESAMLAAYTLVPEPGWRILDLCAAPGGKASHLAERMGGRGEVVAVDIHPHKIELIQEAAQRLG
ncbi:MAG: 16S rRNA (cytosine(967)-C(5))-methyltransferase RsmB, partial [Alicyclobacillaceae bacterium]|nr:16S rRNA (cytosine(967)-C(5))-methyltransferase RsmB [Alicyclobacillaceae bacterium]